MGTISNKIVLEGEKDYNAALKEIKAAQSELRSEMKLSQSAFKDQQNSLDALKEKHEILSKQYDVQTKKVELNRQAIEMSTKKEQEAAEKIEELKEALADAEKEMEQMKGSSTGTSEALKAQSETVKDLQSKLALAEQGYDKAALKTEFYRTSLNYASVEQKNLENELKNTEKHIEEAAKSADGCAESIDQYGKEVQQAAKETSVFGDVLKADLVSDAIKKGVTEIADGIKKITESATESGSEFEASMSQVAATMGMTAEEINQGSAEYELLANSAKQCGKETKYSASEAGEALNYLALAGYNAQKSAETLPKVLDLAAAGSLDLAYASDLVTDSMAALNMETSQLDNYIDQMAKTSQKSNTSVAQLGEATLVCAGTVSLTGQKLETMNAELGVLANNGIKGAEGGTHLRNILLSLSAPTDKAAIAIEQLGLKVSDSQGNMRDLNDIIIDLDASMAGMSSTEKTQMINRIFNKTDIAAVNALLKGTGDEFDNLYAEINDCSGAAKNMADTMNNNLKGKVTILKSALEGLGISAYEIFDDTMKNSVDSATSAVGRLQKSIDRGDLGVSLNKLSKSMGDFAENALDVGEDALPVVIDALSWLLDNSDVVAAGITGIVAANMQMKVVGPAVEAVRTAWIAYQKANEGATVSQWLLNTAMNANPAGILVTAIVGLTAAMAAYAIMSDDALDVIEETTQKTRELTEDSKALNEQLANGTAERKSNREGMEAQAEICKKLAGELKDLQSKTSLTTSEQARQKIIVEQLNQAMPELNLAIDEQTGLINMSTKALEDNIDSMMALAKAEAAREDLTRIAEDQYEAEKNLVELREQLEEQTQQVTKAQEEYNEAAERFNGADAESAYAYMNAMDNSAEKLREAQEAQAELQSQIEATEESIEGFNAEYGQTLEYISDTEAQAEATAAIEEVGCAAEEAGGKFSGMSAEVQAALSEMQTSMEETISEQIELFSEFDGAAKLTTEELLNNMQSQVDGITQWADNLTELADRGISQGLLKQLEDMGPEGAAYVATFMEMTDEELQKANELFAESLTIPTEASEKATEAYAEAGKNAADGYKEGIEENAENAVDAAEQMAQDTLDKIDETLDINSPSKKTKTSGGYVAEGLGVGMKEEAPNVINIVADICGEIIRTSENFLQTSTFIDIGKQIPAGMEIGIRSGKPDLLKAINEMCTESIQEAKRTLDINSPSKKYDYLGEMSGAGYIGGLEREMAKVNAVIEASLPETAMNLPYSGTPTQNIVSEHSKTIIPMEVNIYSPTDDLIETSRKFKETMQEVARSW